jgi:hypothetical protein
MIKFSDNGIHLLKYQPNRRQLTVTLRNQYHLPNRHVFMERTINYFVRSLTLSPASEAFFC